MEVWKDIENYEGWYQVSNKGRVRSLRRKTKKGWRGGDTSRTPNGILLLHECVTANRKRGWQTYLQVKLTKDGKQKHFLVHRLVANSFLRKSKGKEIVNHKDGDKHNNCVENLEWVTQSQNILHSYKELGRKPSIPKGRKVKCVETGEVFNSEREASRAYGMKSSSQIGAVCRKRRKYETAAKKHWVFVE